MRAAGGWGAPTRLGAAAGQLQCLVRQPATWLGEGKDDLDEANDVVVELLEILCGNPPLGVTATTDGLHRVAFLNSVRTRKRVTKPGLPSRAFHFDAISAAYASLVTG